MFRFPTLAIAVGVCMLCNVSIGLADDCQCPNCQYQRMLHQRQQQAAIARMFNEDYALWINNPLGRRYNPVQPIPRGLEYLEMNRRRNSATFGPGSNFNQSLDRILNNLKN